MRGIGRASGAISVVNALLSGRGAALGLGLGCEALAELDRARPGEVGSVTIAPPSDTPLVRASVAAALRWIGPNENFRLRLELRSDVPWSCGLKSSSAVSVAVLDAVARARGRAPRPGELAERSAVLCRDAGLSATGAFDDALAAAGGGLALAENLTRRVVAWQALPEPWVAVVWVPPGAHPPSPELAGVLAAKAEEGERAFEAVRAGDLAGALTRNGRAVETALGLEYEPLRQRVRAAGALASGVSGLGPAFAVLSRPADAGRVAAALPAAEGRVLTAPLRGLGELPPPTSGSGGGPP